MRDREGLLSQEETSHTTDSLSDPLAGEPALRQGWVSDGQGHTLTRTGWLCTVLALCLNLNLMSGP